MRIPIANEGYMFILPLAVLTGACWALSWFWATGLFGGLFLFVTWFFRDPERSIPEDPKSIVSPGDGKVVEIVPEKDPLLEESYTRISIFLNVFNVHVNRVPISGKIQATRYNPGKFLNAASHKASLDNEQSAILLNNGHVTILVKQIAGLIARRIVCWAKEGDEYERGQRFGLIRFGSRVDIFVPEGTEIKVAVGDIVSGGSSIIGFLK
ncbi:MAG: phosphatidylserine decarboxylase family protein [Nitrospina sp.]|jgi:phosphatidylserine decarboxylase|nr:phosphatidylserine decarboxylase family protein [Nitrospina sp.]MBT3510236.1 phosphatidylserine decarboxylase family protein [Nitrospina sp.]MBT3876795.1 phosphatidylserine decarboxylase family protein [Nitrospina sp.]MBT4048151.1 phosphatidylserine decarboxylase family protein [Nitrospina sp.]MBT4556837.1 phosphatidylserine decarboxylase family protein [Nitrospina sp.]